MNKLHIQQSTSAFFKLIRLPNLLIILFAQLSIRIIVIGPKEDWKTIVTDIHFLLLCAATLLIAAAGYIINDYYDIKIDLINNPKRVVIGKIFTRRVALLAHFIINSIAIALSLFQDWKIFSTVFISGFLMWYYSNSLKRKFLIGNLTISILSGISIFYLSFLSNSNLQTVIAYALFAFMLSLIREIIKDLEDMEGDIIYGCTTVPIVWGIQKTKYLIFCSSIIFLAIIGFLFMEHCTTPLILYFTAVILPLFLYLLVKLHSATTEKDFHFLSNLCKLIMLVGLVSTLLV